MAHSGSQSQRSREAHREKPSNNNDNSNRSKNPDSCLYIGNIDKRLSQEKLRAAFEQHGEIEYCYIVYEPHSGIGSARGEPKQSRGYGFAKYRNEDDAQRAKQKMNGLDLNGRRITVEVSKRNRPREPTPGRYLGKKRASPVRRSGYRGSYSRSSSRQPKKHRHRHHEKKHRHRHYDSRSRSPSYRKRRSSYSRSPRR